MPSLGFSLGKEAVAESIVSKVPFHGLLSLPLCPDQNLIVVYLWGNGWFVSQSGTEPLLHWEGGRWIATDRSVWKKIGSGRKGRWTDRWEERGLCKATTLCGPVPPPLWLGYFPLFLIHAGEGASDKVPGNCWWIKKIVGGRKN